MPLPPSSSSSLPAPAPGRPAEHAAVADAATAAAPALNSAAHQAAAAAFPSPMALAIAGYGYGFGGFPPMAARAPGGGGGDQPGSGTTANNTLEALIRYAGWNNNNNHHPPWAPPPPPPLLLSPSAIMASAAGLWTPPPPPFSSGPPPPPLGTNGGGAGSVQSGGAVAASGSSRYDLRPDSRGKPPTPTPSSARSPLGQNNQITAATGSSSPSTRTCKTKSLAQLTLTLAGGGGAEEDEEGEGERLQQLGPAVLAMPTTTTPAKVAVAAPSGGGRVRNRRPARDDDDVTIGGSGSNSKPATPFRKAASSRPQRASSASSKKETDKDGAHANHAVVILENLNQNQNQNQPAAIATPAKSGTSAMAGARAGGVRAPSPASSGRKRRSAVATPPPSRSRQQLVAVAPAPPPTPAAEKKHTILTFLIDGGFLSEGETVIYVPGGVATAAAGGSGGSGSGVSGLVTRAGVRCSCCDTTVSLPAFEAHGGRPSAAAAAGGPGSHQQRRRRRQAWEELLLVSGGSLLWCLQDAWEAEKVRTFQAQARTRAALERLEEKNSMAKKRLLARHQRRAGVVVDRIMSPRMEKIKAAGAEKDSNDDACGICADGGELVCCDTCTSTFHQDCVAVEVPEGTWSCHYCQCKLCKSNDVQDPSLSPKQLLIGIEAEGLSTCQQCTLKYHESCRPLPDNGRDISAYCSETCKKLSAQLSDVTGVTNLTEDGFSWALLRIQKDEPASSEEMPAVLERNVKLAVALGVLNECFNPVMDQRTKIDMLRQAVYSLGSEYRRLSYERFYTMVLEKDSEIVSVALLRVHDTKLAEMPFAGTLPAYRKQGMMHRLVNAVEQVLASVQVEKLVIPAIASMVDTWKKSFAFTPVEPPLREELKALSLVVITGTTLLYKPVVAASPPPPLPPPPPPPQQQEPDKGKGKAAAVVSGPGPDPDPEAWWRKYADPAARLTDDERAFLEMDPDAAAPPLFRYADLVTGDVSLNGLCRAGNASSSMACATAAVSPPGRGRAGGWLCRGEAASAIVPLPRQSYGRGGRSGILHGMK